MQEDYEDSIPFEEIVPLLDIKYEDGNAFMSVHTVDQMNEFIAQLVDEIQTREVVQLSDQTVAAVMWIMSLWQKLHDAIDLEATARNIPDTPEDLFND